MGNVELYLEGPGQERRPVTKNSTETISEQDADPFFSQSVISPDQLNVLVDAEGNLARQVDREGYRYRFSGSEITWSLSVG